MSSLSRLTRPSKAGISLITYQTDSARASPLVYDGLTGRLCTVYVWSGYGSLWMYAVA